MKSQLTRSHLFLFFFILLTISCGKESVEDMIVGKWVYERETFSSFSTFEDPDVSGLITFLDDETGSYESNFSLARDLEWDLQVMDSKISVTQYLSLVSGDLFTNTTIYDLDIKSDNEIVLNYTAEFETISDSLESLFIFENLILTRVE